MLEPGAWNKKFYDNEAIYPIESNDQDFINKLIADAFKSKTTEYAPIALYSVTNFQRSFIQQSTFTLHSSLTPMDLGDEYNLITKFIIPKNEIRKFKCVLSALGISEIAIYSDLDTLGKWTKKLNKY